MDKTTLYPLLIAQAKALLGLETDAVANMANLSALMYTTLPDLNWAGFYILKNKELVLGPFQGGPACVRIQPGKGVCGACAQQRRTIVVADVHQFDGHIACDARSRSEIVVPLIKNEKLYGVLDVDSPLLNRFDEADKKGLEALAEIFLQTTNLD